MPAPLAPSNPRGAAVRERRVELGLTQTWVAQRSGVPQGTISAIERGIQSPGVEIARRLAVALDTTVEALFPLAVEDVA